LPIPRSLLLICVAVAGLCLGGCIREKSLPTPTPTVDDTFSVVTEVPKETDGTETKRTYVVEEGDTLSAIADMFGVSESALIAANDLDNPDDIYVGQELTIP
jgi:LysM repeat protein